MKLPDRYDWTAHARIEIRNEHGKLCRILTHRFDNRCITFEWEPGGLKNSELSLNHVENCSCGIPLLATLKDPQIVSSPAAEE